MTGIQTCALPICFPVTIPGVGGVILGIVGWPAVIVAAIIGAIAEVVIVIHDNWDAIVKWFQQTCTTIGTFFSNLFAPVVDGINSVISFFENIDWSAIFAPIVSFFTGLWDTISGIFIGVGTWVYDNILSPVINIIVTGKQIGRAHV